MEKVYSGKKGAKMMIQKIKKCQEIGDLHKHLVSGRVREAKFFRVLLNNFIDAA